MAKGNESKKVQHVWEDLDIDYTDWQDNPKEFSKRVADKARQMAAELDKPNTVLSAEENFKAKALANTEAAAKAEELIANIKDVLMGDDTDVMVNFVARIGTLTSDFHKIIHTMAMRNSRGFSKARTHAMYVRLRKAYETYVEFQKWFNPEVKTLPIIPAKPGNYSSSSIGSGMRELVFKLDDEEYFNYYTVARILGIEISTYMDLVEFFDKNKEHKGYALSYREIGGDK